ncbi:MAG: type IV pilus assembly protein PilM [Bacillota bacterium]
MLKKRYLAIDIGSSKIKMVHGGLEKGKIVVYEYDTADTPASSFEDGKITNIDTLTYAIRELIRKNRIKEKNLVLTITGTGIITRDIQIPKSTDEEIEKILEFEAQQYFPVELDNYILDFKVQEEIESGEGTFNRILLVAAPKNQVDEYMKLHKKLKMEIEAIDIPANNVFKFFFGESYQEKIFENKELPQEFAALDVGAKTTGVYIFSSGKLKFSRILLNGSMDIDELISSHLNVDFKQAEELKIMMGKLVGDDAENTTDEIVQMSNMIKPAVSNIMNDVSRFFEFYNSRSSGNRLERIYIFGGGSKLIGLDSYLSTYFGLPVEYLLPAGYIDYKGRKNQEEFINDFILLVNAIGGVVRS